MTRPLYSQGIERAVVGSMMIDPAAINTVLAAGVTRRHFRGIAEQAVFNAVVDLADTLAPVDTVSVARALEESGRLDDVGGYSGLMDLFSVIPTTINIGHYVKVLDELYQRRRRIEDAEAGLHLLQDGDDDEAARKLQAAAVSIEADKLLRPMEMQLLDFDAAFKAEEEGGRIGATTGFDQLDEMLGGFVAGRSYAIAGRTSEGKTAIAMQMALSCAQGLDPVHVFSREMPHVDLDRRLVSVLSHVSLPPGAARRLTPQQRERVAHARQMRAGVPIQIDDRALTLDQTVAEARRLKGRVKLFIIDHARLVTVPGARGEYEAVTAVSAACAAIALECEAAVLLVCQINREGVRDGTPKLQHIQSTGAIAQDASAVMIIVRNDYGKVGSRDNGAVLRVLKNRNGALGGIALEWQPRLVRFVPTDGEVRDDE